MYATITLPSGPEADSEEFVKDLCAFYAREFGPDHGADPEIIAVALEQRQAILVPLACAVPVTIIALGNGFTVPIEQNEMAVIPLKDPTEGILPKEFRGSEQMDRVMMFEDEVPTTNARPIRTDVLWGLLDSLEIPDDRWEGLSEDARTFATIGLTRIVCLLVQGSPDGMLVKGAFSSVFALAQKYDEFVTKAVEDGTPIMVADIYDSFVRDTMEMVESELSKATPENESDDPFSTSPN